MSDRNYMNSNSMSFNGTNLKIMEKFECCGGIECSEKCIECQAYEQANRTKERAQKVLYALSIEDKIVSEAQNINDASKIQDIIN